MWFYISFSIAIIENDDGHQYARYYSFRIIDYCHIKRLYHQIFLLLQLKPSLKYILISMQIPNIKICYANGFIMHIIALAMCCTV